MELLDYYHIVIRRKWLIMVCVFSVMFLVLLYTYLSSPVFEASAKLLLIDDKNLNTLEGISFENMIMGTIGKSDPLSTQIEIMKTRPIIDDVIKKTSLVDKNGNPVQTERVMKKFKFEAIRNTNIIFIHFRDANSKKAAQVVNTLCEVFIEKNQQLNLDDIYSTGKFLEDQLSIQKIKLDEAERVVMEFKSKTQIVTLGKEIDLHITALAELKAQKIQLESELNRIQAQKTAIDSRLNKNGSQAAPLYSNWYTSSEQLSINFATLESQLTTINKQINIQSRLLKTIPPIEIQYARLTREEKIANTIYTNLLSKYEEIKIREAAKIANIKVIEPAVIQDKPISSKKKIIFPLALAAGLFLGFGIAFILEYLKTVQERETKPISE